MILIVMMIIVMMDHCDDGDDYDNNYSDGVDVGKEGNDLDKYDNDELRIQIIIFGSICFKNDDDNRLHDDYDRSFAGHKDCERSASRVEASPRQASPNSTA